MKKKLTPKQAKFVREYLIDLNATQAAIRAGYSEKTAKSQGGRLLTNVDVMEAIGKHTKKAIAKNELTVETVLANIDDMRKRAKDAGHFTGEGNALNMQAKYLKMLTDRIEHSGSISNESELTDAELSNIASSSGDRTTETPKGKKELKELH